MGEIRGKLDGRVRAFLCIPYAAPPIGDLRWLPPQPPAGWSGVLDATKAGNQCAQARIRDQGVAGSEDCLFLNIYAPDTPDKALPVMVWIHGGTFLVGSGSQYDGRELAERGHLILVTINYRLGPFGFLVNRSLDGADPGQLSGNYGLLDQQAALRWVKDNIEAFGGDPGKVTVAGESAGAISIGLQLVSPGAVGSSSARSSRAGRSCICPRSPRPGRGVTNSRPSSGVLARPRACDQSRPRKSWTRFPPAPSAWGHRSGFR